jgi:urea transport system permease protein
MELRRWFVVVAAVAALLLPSVARAADGDFEAALRVLCESSPDAVTRGAQAIAACGDPRGLRVLQALRDGDLVVSDAGTVYVRGEDGQLKDALTGGASGREPQRTPDLDNGVRRVLVPLIARLQMQSPDGAVRLEGVEELAKRGSDDDAVLLRAAMEHEKQADVRRAITLFLAEHDLASDDAGRRLAAVQAIRSASSERFRARLQALGGQKEDGSFEEPDPRVRAAATDALRSLDREQFFVGIAADLLYGLSTGSVLLLSALGLAITFGVMGVINMAHGEMLMIGAYATYATQVFFRAHVPAHESLYVIAAIPVAFLSCLAVGAVLERAVIRFLYGRPLETLLATYGLSLLLIQVVRSLFGAQNVAVETPSWIAGGKEIFEGVVIPYNRVAVVIFAVIVVAFVSYILRGTSLGLRVRAVTQNRPMAACMGISTGRVDTWTFALGSGVGGLGGVALAQLGNVGPELGQGYIVDSFLVVVLGGVGKLLGTVVAAFSLGILNKVLEPVAGAVLGKIVVLLAVVLVIQKRPQGLFAPRGRSVEVA